MSGKFITFEGGEGCGKSTQTRLLADYLQKSGISCLLTKEPGGTAEGKILRELLVTGDCNKLDAISECLLYYADRRNHLTKVVWPALQDDKWVISDRYADSTEAYQYYGYDKRVEYDTLKSLYRIVAGDFKPDLTIILNIDPKLGMERSFAKAETMTKKELRFEQRDMRFHENLRRGFLEIAAREPERCIVIDADCDITALHNEIIKVVRQRFGI